VGTIIVVGRDKQKTIDSFSRARGGTPLMLPPHDEDYGHAAVVRLGSGSIRFRASEPTSDRRRHRRKYAEGRLGEDRSFYFRGPDGRLNLRAQNLEMFMQMADGVDDATWEHHLRQHDVSRWFRGAIKDESLAEETAAIESRDDLSATESRAHVRAAIQSRYSSRA
jgi:hypothetical protein